MARLRGPDLYRQMEEMTRLAMDGAIPLGDVFGRRLALIKPSRQETEAIGQKYIETIEPHARAVVNDLRAAGWELAILSGGYRQAIRPLADFLGVERVEAVDLFFDDAGAYRGFDTGYPTARNGGKPEVVKQLRAERGYDPVVMVGDGASDLETGPAVNFFVGFGRYVSRPLVREQADRFIISLDELPALLARTGGRRENLAHI
jgi:phosphoserine phosphatase